MNDDERFWIEHAEDLRRLAGLCPLTPAEAEEELKKRSKKRASNGEIDAIINAVVERRLPEREWQPDPDWNASYEFSEMDREAALCRNRGEHGPEGNKEEDEFFDQLMNDDDTEENKG